jgi:hypothetical protein
LQSCACMTLTAHYSACGTLAIGRSIHCWIGSCQAACMRARAHGCCRRGNGDKRDTPGRCSLTHTPAGPGSTRRHSRFRLCARRSPRRYFGRRGNGTEAAALNLVWRITRVRVPGWSNIGGCEPKANIAAIQLLLRARSATVAFGLISLAAREGPKWRLSATTVYSARDFSFCLCPVHPVGNCISAGASDTKAAGAVSPRAWEDPMRRFLDKPDPQSRGTRDGTAPPQNRVSP